MGVFFSAGWSPCIGPVLGAVMTLALKTNNIGRGILLLSTYSLGLGVPCLLAAAGVGQVSDWLRRFRKHMRYTSIVAGLLLIVIGVLLFTDSPPVFSRFAFVSNILRPNAFMNLWGQVIGLPILKQGKATIFGACLFSSRQSIQRWVG